jgi:hypothetical protein
MLSNRFAKVYQGSAMNPILRKAFAAFALMFISGCTKTIDLGCDDCPPPLSLPASASDVVERVTPGYTYFCQLSDSDTEKQSCVLQRRQLILACADKTLPKQMTTQKELDKGLGALHACVYPKR